MCDIFNLAKLRQAGPRPRRVSTSSCSPWHRPLLRSLLYFLPFPFTTMDASGRSSSKCGSCAQYRPHRAWDEHLQCPACRVCSRRVPCVLCTGFTEEYWGLIGAWLAARAAKRVAQGEGLVDKAKAPKPASKGRGRVRVSHLKRRVVRSPQGPTNSLRRLDWSGRYQQRDPTGRS